MLGLLSKKVNEYNNDHNKVPITYYTNFDNKLIEGWNRVTQIVW